jgi:hypothetical protein
MLALNEAARATTVAAAGIGRPGPADTSMADTSMAGSDR